MRVALFGTSADPPTSGHQKILNWLSQYYDWVAVWAADNPLKSHQTALAHRSTMLRLLIEEMRPPRHNIGFYPELSSRRTLETVEKAKKLWSSEKVDFTLVIGADLVNQLPCWYKAEELLQQVQILVVPRPGYTLENEDLQQLKDLALGVEVADLTGLDVSSTAYRNYGDDQVITPQIQAYIHQEQLYKCQDTSKKSLPIH
ncbi:nicotinate-nucleotide adenylyltransferase [Synechocystis sp. PCC 7509]|uniref:nicotinate-nucleotide adenylyltransferase n=1 Tax=Synechocystis sp. PCC 7509 TaxID=927677 RepID=UPI0002ABEB0E|nr:nicotinate-nucleotide adenylyltransferase [Synechocystis sp. PCC 7509]